MFIKIILICAILTYTSAQGVVNKEYKLERYFKTNWFNANIFCRDHGMRLATVNSVEENEVLANVISPRDMQYNNPSVFDSFWISATDLAEEGRFTWFSTGNAVTYTVWSPYHPTRSLEYVQPVDYDNTEDCVQITGEYRQWETVNCTVSNYFICERV